MDKKDYDYLVKDLDRLFVKDLEEICLKICMEFVKQNKRNPTDEEMKNIIDCVGKKLAEEWNKNPQNFKFVKKKIKQEVKK